MWYLTGDTQDMRTEFDSEDEASVYLRASGFIQVDGGEDWTTYEYDDPVIDGPVTVTLQEGA